MSAVWLCGSCLACGYTLKKKLAEQAFRMLAQRPGRHSFLSSQSRRRSFHPTGCGWALAGRCAFRFPFRLANFTMRALYMY